jgi:two-component system NtrC family sensor kinase
MSPNNTRLLLVDDEPGVALTLQMILQRNGYNVSVAYSCAEALAKLNGSERFHGVITDLNMETEDIGLEVVKAAQRLKPRPVTVVCTGYATLDNTQAALDMKVDYLATKPVDIDVFITAVNRLVRRKRSIGKKVGA